MCRVKAIASSVERLLRYANCSGSSEAGSTEQMWSLMSFSLKSKTLTLPIPIDSQKMENKFCFKPDSENKIAVNSILPARQIRNNVISISS